jgi:APA family basic amino acid/polyamine antiporter
MAKTSGSVDHQRRPRMGERSRPYRILLPLTSLPEAEGLLPLAEALLRERRGQLIILHVVTVPESHSLSEAASEASQYRQEIESFFADRGQKAARVRTVVRAAREVWEGIWETVEEKKIDLLLLGWDGVALPETAVGDSVDRRLASPPCDVVTVHLGEDLFGEASKQGWQGVQRILLPVRGGPHAALGLRVSHALAETLSATVTLLHVTGQAPRDAEAQLFATFGPALRGLERLTRSVTTTGDVSQAIIEGR